MAEINQRRTDFEEERMQLIEEAKQAGYQEGFKKGRSRCEYAVPSYS
ncbi:hypothetical protein BsIDN1_29650 [Bacillus safensis]|uniref:Uncharacterized protein n=1 Tax=Bacillus safensis TaxID=561879 RepID=A0A5S9M766_BACIA|nr:hypothetical protein BsIDN1_29650 [Bacillus safensis]